METRDREIVKRFRHLLESRVKPYRVIVFGSRARGEASEDSDLDVLVILPDAVDWETRLFISRCAWEAGFEEGILITPVVMSRQEAEESPERSSLLMEAVRREGIAI